MTGEIIMNNDIPVQYAYDRESGKRVLRDQAIEDFRGEQWFFKGVDQQAHSGSGGKIAVTRTCPDAYTTSNGQQDCPHSWHRNGVETGWYYPSVFELYLGLENGEEA